MDRKRFGGIIIESVGYDAQCEVLEIKLCHSGEIIQYHHVPEDTWYAFKKVPHPDLFFHEQIKGNFPEVLIR